MVDLGGSAPVAASGEAPDQALASGLQQRALGWSLLVFFGLGLLLAFTPCSLPMLPILAGLVVGSGAGPRRGLALAGSYVISMALVYAAMGVLAALLGGPIFRRCCNNRGCWAASRPCSCCWHCRCSASSNCNCRPPCVTAWKTPGASSAVAAW
nr:hypothetical protein GCM10020185_07140 [Pseudomonas brassicacearum subsp. brassicacearum]